jgi:hypothetical protein
MARFHHYKAFKPPTEKQRQQESLQTARIALRSVQKVLSEVPVFDMLLRDQFASYAIACAAWANGDYDLDAVAKRAYLLADRMLKARKRNTT